MRISRRSATVVSVTGAASGRRVLVGLLVSLLVGCAGGSGTATTDPNRPADVAAETDETDEAGVTPNDGCDDERAVGDISDLDHVDVDQIGQTDTVTVSAAVYPLPDTPGNPWSQWGQGVVLPDGRFISAVGDHLGRDGTSWFFEFDPATSRLTRTSEVSEALGHVEGDWGYGKVHAPMQVSACGDVIAATYWGTRQDLELGESYQGDQLIRYDTATHEIVSLGVPVIGHGLPSIALSPDRRSIFGEAVDPASDPDGGVFFVADAETGSVTSVHDDGPHVGFRSILVNADGEGLYSTGDGGLLAVNPQDGSERTLPDVLPGAWLRAATTIAPDGSVYGATREPDALFRLDSSGELTDLGELPDYVASLAVSPDGRTLYYVPGAHGSSWVSGTPLVAVDIESGEHTEVVRLNDMIEPSLGVRAGGTYNIAVDPTGRRVYVGLNAGPIDGEEAAFGSIVLAVVEFR